MPYTARGQNGELKGTWKNQTGAAGEFFIADDDPELTQLKQRRANRERVESAIQNQMRVLAIQQLKAGGKIRANYPEPNIDDVSNVTDA